jgi:RNA polymerase sigma factor (sigma-70 family)
MDELVARARDGDKAAEQHILQHLLVRFELFAKRRIRDGDTSRDIAQEACVTVLAKYKTEVFTTGFGPWAYGVLRMKIGNHIQKAKTERQNISHEFAVDTIAGQSADIDCELKMKLIECLKKISDKNSRYARVLNLTYQGFKTDEICSRLGITPGNFYVILKRGRSMLRLCLDKGEV